MHIVAGKAEPHSPEIKFRNAFRPFSASSVGFSFPLERKLLLIDHIKRSFYYARSSIVLALKKKNAQAATSFIASGVW